MLSFAQFRRTLLQKGWKIETVDNQMIYTSPDEKEFSDILEAEKYYNNLMEQNT